MELFQILDCSTSLGTCCSDSSMIGVLSIVRRILELIQFIVPIVLIIAFTVQFIQLTINPELKDGTRKLINKLIATVIIFLLPTIVDVILSTTTNEFKLSSCWIQAKSYSSEIGFSGGTYATIDEDKKTTWLDPVSFAKVSRAGMKKSSGTSKQKQIVAYAEQFVGEEYVFGGYWNGEKPYTPTDCSGFVTAIYRHFGVNLPRGVNMFGYDTSLYTVVSPSNIQPGDVVMYDGHVGILTGNGNEIIHAKGTKWGVVKDPDYTRCSSHKILGILRIKGI